MTARCEDPCILIADDQLDVLQSLRLLLKPEGFQVETVTTPEQALEAARAHQHDVVLADLNYSRDTTSGEEGMALLASLQAIDPTLPVVVRFGSTGPSLPHASLLSVFLNGISL